MDIKELRSLIILTETVSNLGPSRPAVAWAREGAAARPG